MRDPGLARAIDKAGGVAELARKIGIAQPSVSNWERVPAQRVIAVEAATGISRRDLRPDLYDESELVMADQAIDPVDAGRAHQYLLLASLLSAPPSKKLLGALAKLEGDDTQLGRAHAALAEAAQDAAVTAVEAGCLSGQRFSDGAAGSGFGTRAVCFLDQHGGLLQRG